MRYRIEFAIHKVDEDGEPHEIGFGSSEDCQKFSDAVYEVGSFLDNYEFESYLSDAEIEKEIEAIKETEHQPYVSYF